jgi:hypothetical protein
MDALKNAVAAAFENVVISGTIEQAIETHIAKAVTSAIADQFTYSSDFNKAIKAKVASLIDVNLSGIDLPSYRDLVGKIIQKRVGAAMTEQFTELLDKDISEMLSPAPAEITLENLLAEFVTHRMDQYDADDLRGQEFTLHIQHSDSSDGYADIFIDKERATSKYSCAIRLRTRNGGEVWALTIDGNDIENKLFVGPLFSFEKRLFQMYTAKTKLIFPAGATEDDFDTAYPGYDD